MKALIAATFAFAMVASLGALPAEAKSAAAAKPAASAKSDTAAKSRNDQACNAVCDWWNNTKPAKPHQRNKFGG